MDEVPIIFLLLRKLYSPLKFRYKVKGIELEGFVDKHRSVHITSRVSAIDRYTCWLLT